MASDLSTIERAIRAAGYTVKPDGDHKKVYDPAGNVVRINSVPFEISSSPSDWRASNNLVRNLIQAGVLPDDPRRSGQPKRQSVNGDSTSERRAQLIWDRVRATLVEMGVGEKKGAISRLAELVDATGLMNKKSADSTLRVWEAKAPKSVTQKTFDAFQTALDIYWGVEPEPQPDTPESTPPAPSPAPVAAPKPEPSVAAASWSEVVEKGGARGKKAKVEPEPAPEEKEQPKLTAEEQRIEEDWTWAYNMLGEVENVTQPDAKAAILYRIGARLEAEYSVKPR